MRRAIFILLVLLSGAAPARPTDVAVVTSTPPPAWSPVLDSLKAGLGGQAVSRYDLLGDRAAAARILSGIPSDGIVVAVGPFAAQAVHEIAPALFLVYCMVPDPAAAGLAGAAHTAGVAASVPVRNQLAAFRAVYPRAVRLGVVHGPGAEREVADAEKAALVVRMVLVPRPVATEREVAAAVRGLVKGPDAVDALWMPADPLFASEDARRQVLSEAAAAGKPVFAYESSVVAEGALASNGPDLAHVGERAATLVNRIAAEKDAAKLEVLFPRAELALNKRVAAQLKLDLPPDVLGAAQKVF
jgi:putative ABC transport system substrate-binding protein